MAITETACNQHRVSAPDVSVAAYPQVVRLKQEKSVIVLRPEQARKLAEALTEAANQAEAYD